MFPYSDIKDYLLDKEDIMNADIYWDKKEYLFQKHFNNYLLNQMLKYEDLNRQAKIITYKRNE